MPAVTLPMLLALAGVALPMADARKFAIAALDKTEQDAPTAIWKELNGR